MKVFSFSQEYRTTVKELLGVIDDVLRKRKKRLSHLRFARPTMHGWFFFRKKRVPWDAFDEITHIFSRDNPSHKKEKIAHMLSELVNMAKKDILRLRSIL